MQKNYIVELVHRSFSVGGSYGDFYLD